MSTAGRAGLAVRGLSVDYRTPAGPVHALRNVSLDVPPGAIVGVVGESGCGKSSLISAIIGLKPENAQVTSGTIEFDNENLLDLSSRQMRDILGDRISVVFQDPMASLNPVRTVGRQMIDIQSRSSRDRADKQRLASEMLDKVGISDPDHRLRQYAHELSGGMRQRISIAMALMAEPALLIADEPTTALDATLEVQILRLLRQLQRDIGCSVLFVSHHLAAVASLCDKVVVLYAGEVVEQGATAEVFRNPRHPYTQRLLECDPGRIETPTRQLPTIPGELPNLSHLPAGCVFANRCALRFSDCDKAVPQFHEPAPTHFVRCHLFARPEVRW